MIYDTIWHIWYDTIWYIWYMIWYDIHDMIRYDIYIYIYYEFMIYDLIWFDIWLIWHDMIIDMTYDMIWHDMIYLSTAVGLSPGGNSTVHIYTQTKHRTTLTILEYCWPCPVFAGYCEFNNSKHPPRCGWEPRSSGYQLVALFSCRRFDTDPIGHIFKGQEYRTDQVVPKRL